MVLSWLKYFVLLLCLQFNQIFNNHGPDAIATANLLNFIGDAIPDVRKELLKKGVDLAQF